MACHIYLQPPENCFQLECFNIIFGNNAAIDFKANGLKNLKLTWELHLAVTIGLSRKIVDLFSPQPLIEIASLS